jgi:hypothetical protein
MLQIRVGMKAGNSHDFRHLKGQIFGVWGKSVGRGTEFQQFCLRILYFWVNNSVLFLENSVLFWEAPVVLL